MAHPRIPDVRVFWLEVGVLEDDHPLEPREEDPVDHGKEDEKHKAEEGQHDSTNQTAFSHVVIACYNVVRNCFLILRQVLSQLQKKSVVDSK